MSLRVLGRQHVRSRPFAVAASAPLLTLSRALSTSSCTYQRSGAASTPDRHASAQPEDRARTSSGATTAPTTADEIFARTFKTSTTTPLAGMRARTEAAQRHDAVPSPQSARADGSDDGQADISAVDVTTSNAVSSVDKVFANQQKRQQDRWGWRRKRSASGGATANPAAWQGLRHVWSRLKTPVASGTQAHGSASPPPPWWFTAPHPPPVYGPVSPQDRQNAQLYERAYARWETDNDVIVRALEQSPHIKDAAKRAVEASRKRSFREFEQQTLRWTLWYVFPLMLIAHTAFFTDALLFGQTLENIPYVKYDEYVPGAR